MTTTTLSRATEREAGKEPEPAKMWRNKWLGLRLSGGICDDGKGGGCSRWHELKPGDELMTCCSWPTRDEAERVAAGTMRIRDDVAYLGPIPVPSC